MESYIKDILACRFNSIKVRLEREMSDEARAALLFQFHKGTIRTKPGLYCMRSAAVSIP